MPKINEEDRLRAEIAALGEDKYLRRYEGRLRRRVVVHARRRLSRGESLLAVARSLDMAPATLTKLMRSGSGHGDQRPRGAGTVRTVRSRTLVPIEVVPEIGRSTWPEDQQRISIHGPFGLRIDGLTMDGLATLIARLSKCSG